MITTLAIANYRSLREFIIQLSRLNLITGGNGSGKSNVYRALRLLAETAQGQVIPALAREGGLGSTLWAGPERPSDLSERPGMRTESVNLKLGFASEDYGYCIDLGLPQNGGSAFSGDPEIKRECIWNGAFLRPAALLADRKGALARARQGKNEWMAMNEHLASFDSMLAQCADPRNAPEMLLLRERMRAWRFYDHFRSDAQAPARVPQIGTRTPVLSNDGADLAAALETIREIGDDQALRHAVDDAFPGCSVGIEVTKAGFSLKMRQPGLLRPLGAAELSDGTLRYLLWIAALLSPRPPAFLVLNEPESSLHPDLLPALARLIAQASSRSQVLVVSHATRLIAALEQEAECHSMTLEKQHGATRVAGLHTLDVPPWHWPSR
jgi:predicted ATPase